MIQDNTIINVGNTRMVDVIDGILSTSMSRLYKMPLLYSFFRGDRMVLHAGWDDIARSFREFYSNASNRVDIKGLKHFDRYDEIPDSKWVSLAKENPIHFLVKGSPGFFSEDDDGFHLSGDLAPYVDLRFFIDQVRDAMEYRVMDFRRTCYMERDG